MTIPDLTFRLDVNCSCSFVDFITWFHNEWLQLDIVWQENITNGETKSNRIQLGKNSDFDPEKANNPDGWFNFPYFVLVVTKHNPAPTFNNLIEQRDFASRLVQLLSQKACIVKVHADFDLEEV